MPLSCSGRCQLRQGVASKAKFGAFPKWLKDSEKTSAADAEKIRETFEWITIYEVYDFTADRYYHMLEDQEDPLFEGDLPYVFVRNPFKMLTFNDNLSDIGGMADSQLVERQQRRLNELETLYAYKEKMPLRSPISSEQPLRQDSLLSSWTFEIE